MDRNIAEAAAVAAAVEPSVGWTQLLCLWFCNEIVRLQAGRAHTVAASQAQGSAASAQTDGPRRSACASDAQADSRVRGCSNVGCERKFRPRSPTQTERRPAHVRRSAQQFGRSAGAAQLAGLRAKTAIRHSRPKGALGQPSERASSRQSIESHRIEALRWPT